MFMCFYSDRSINVFKLKANKWTYLINIQHSVHCTHYFNMWPIWQCTQFIIENHNFLLMMFSFHFVSLTWFDNNVSFVPNPISTYFLVRNIVALSCLHKRKWKFREQKFKTENQCCGLEEKKRINTWNLYLHATWFFFQLKI